MNLFKNILITVLLISPFEFVFPQKYQLGLNFGQTKFKKLDKYLETIIDGPYYMFDDNYFDTGYIFNKNSFSSKTYYNIGVSFEYNLTGSICPFVNITYFNIKSNGDCQVSPLLSGGLADQNTRFTIKSNFYIAKLGANLNFKTRYLTPFVSFKIIYNNININDVKLLDVNEDFIRYSKKYTVNTINNIGLGLGFGIKIPIIRRLQLFTNADYDNLNLIYGEVNKSLIFYSISLGILIDI